MFSIRYILYAFLLIVYLLSSAAGLQSSKNLVRHTTTTTAANNNNNNQNKKLSTRGTSFYRDIHNRCMANARLTRSTAKRALGGNAVDLLASSLPSPSSSSSGVGTTSFNWKKSLEVGIYLTLWYFFSGWYNIYNKKALNILKMPWFVATSQMGMGFLIFIPMWLLKIRERPANDFEEFKIVFSSLTPVGFYQALTHASGVIALGAGAVSFTQIVKASEPAFTAAISGIFFREFLPWQAYTALIPVMLGVSMASVTELTFSWFCLGSGMMANIFAAARGVFGKKQMCGEIQCVETLSADNYYAVLTIVSFFMLVPVTILMEGSKIKQLVEIANYQEGLRQMLKSGVLFYLYNEVSFKALNNLNPVSHALANTVKRIVIIVSSVIFFGETLTPIGTVGASLAIAGVFAYSMACYLCKPKKKEKET